jgi:hypothetical protein
MSFFPILDCREVLYNLPDEIQEDLMAMTPEKEQSIIEFFERFSFSYKYTRHVIIPALLLTRVYQGERLSLPMLDPKKFDKEAALPYYLWGLLYDEWKPNPEQGLSVFIQGYDNRGLDNRRKRIYHSATTLDLYNSQYRQKVLEFFDELLDIRNIGKPLMRKYLDSYFDLYWNLHLGVTGDDIPIEVREIGMSFNTVLAYLMPTEKIVYQNYMKVRDLRQLLQDWIKDKIEDVQYERIYNPERTFVYYWLKNSHDGTDENFRKEDIAFECFHNFVAFSQWGNTIYNIISRLAKDIGDPEVKEWFAKIMTSDYDNANDSPFTPLDRFVMELFRTISPNSGSVSCINETNQPLYDDRYGYIVTPHKDTSEYDIHWEDPDRFNPDRYIKAPTSEEINEIKSREIGFAQCPFHQEQFFVRDGRNTQITNSAFGTVYGVTNGTASPVCDYAGYAPFGFGYRRCPGELFTIEVIKDFLRKVWNERIDFYKLKNASEKVPVGPTAVVVDNIGFTKP